MDFKDLNDKYVLIIGIFRYVTVFIEKGPKSKEMLKQFFTSTIWVNLFINIPLKCKMKSSY